MTSEEALARRAALQAEHDSAQTAYAEWGVKHRNAEVLRGNPNLDHIFVYQKLKHAGGLASRFKAVSDRLKLIETGKRRIGTDSSRRS